jgi:ferrous iron transport protein A
MELKKQVPLPQMRPGQTGKVVDISGGFGVVKKLAALGIRPGQTLTKRDSVFARGPVVVKINHSEVAIGYGMAQKVIVEVAEE